MKGRFLLLLIVVFLFIILVPLQAKIQAAYAESEVKKDTIWLAAGSTASPNGTYHLAGTNWLVSGISTGGAYQLISPLPLSVAGEGCCCTYLPCVFKN